MPNKNNNSLSFIAHELKNSTAVISLTIEMLLKDRSGIISKEQKNELKNILSEAKKINVLAERLKMNH